MNRPVVFDAYAILALLENDTGAQTVTGLLTYEEVDIYLSVINAGEIYYIVLSRNGAQAAEEVIENMFMERALTILDAPWERVKAAASIKSWGGLSYADAFALALAKELGAPLVTGDIEIKGAAQAMGVEIIW